MCDGLNLGRRHFPPQQTWNFVPGGVQGVLGKSLPVLFLYYAAT